MRTLSVGLLGLFVSFFVHSSAAFPCTTFCLNDGKGAVVAKSYDWEFGEGRLYVNKSGVAKQAVVFEGTPVPWTSKFASLTFNQFGREFPNGGMNEAGLVVEVMMLDESSFPKPDKRKTINELQWVQYQLDLYSSVKDVVAHADEIRVAPMSATGKIHYLICDKTGACAAFEYLNGQLKKAIGKDLVAPVLTNDTYAASRDHLKSYKEFGGSKAVPSDASSLSRFVIAAEASKGKKSDPVKAAFETLDRVRNGDYTKWNIVYDSRTMKVHFRSLGHDSIKTVDLTQFFAEQATCKTPVKVLDMNFDGEGDVTKYFVDYMPADNLGLMQTTLGRIPNFPKAMIAMAAAYPSALPCTL